MAHPGPSPALGSPHSPVATPPTPVTPSPNYSHSQSQPWIPSLMLPLPTPSRWLRRGSDSQTFVSSAWAHFLCPSLPAPTSTLTHLYLHPPPATKRLRLYFLL